MDQIPDPTPPFAAPEPDTREESEKRRQLLAAFCSALTPGSEHWPVGFYGESVVLLILFLVLLVLVVSFWPLRLLRFYAGCALLDCAWISVYLCSVGSTQLTRSAPAGCRRSKCWLFVTIAVAILPMSLSGRAVTRAVGFRSFSIPSISMEKTIQRGDRLVVATYYYQSHLPARKDVIVFKTSQTFFVERIIAIGGRHHLRKGTETSSSTAT